MRDFIISTESNADLSQEFIEENNICVIPHYYSIDDEVYGDDKEMTTEEFYSAMRKGKRVATMASNPAVIQERFTQYANEGKDILHISFSSELSGGYGNIVTTANEVMEEFPDRKILVLDTLSATVGEMILIMKALEFRKRGKTIDETIELLRELVPHVCAHFIVDDLNHLYRGGRLSRTSAFVGSLMDVKPILHIDKEGKLVAVGKTRGRKKAISTLLSNMTERLGEWKEKQVVIGVLHGDCEEDANYFKQLIIEKLGLENIIIQALGPSIGAHSGPDLLGIVFLGEYR